MTIEEHLKALEQGLDQASWLQSNFDYSDAQSQEITDRYLKQANESFRVLKNVLSAIQTTASVLLQNENKT